MLEGIHDTNRIMNGGYPIYTICCALAINIWNLGLNLILFTTKLASGSGDYILQVSYKRQPFQVANFPSVLTQVSITL